MAVEILKAYGKINLHLEVFPKRDDGFHDLRSIFHKVDFFDLLKVSKLRESFFNLEKKYDFPIEENILYKTWKQFMATQDIPFGVQLGVEKNIPIGFGMGGGSSNAATLLLWLNRITENPLNDEKLYSIAANLGSDVPFFLGESASYVTGRGEFLEPLQDRRDLHLIIIDPFLRVNTGEAFSWFDNAQKQEKSLGKPELLEKYVQDPKYWPFFNSFTPVIEQKYPVIGEIITSLYKMNADYANLSGTGAAIYAVFKKEPNLDDFLNFFSGYRVWKTKMLASWL